MHGFLRFFVYLHLLLVPFSSRAEESPKIVFRHHINQDDILKKQKGYRSSLERLDTHTGFVVNDGDSLAFIHSSYYRPPFSVTAEPIEGQNPLADSKYRVFGKIFDDIMIEKWITEGQYILKSR